MRLLRVLLASLAISTAVQAKAQDESNGLMPRLDVMVHVESTGDVTGREGSWIGTRGQSLQAEGFQINVDATKHDLSLEYMCHLSNTGDSPYLQEGEFCGSRGEGRQMEGFAIRLTGAAARFYDVEYQCHISGQGDSQVYSNGQYCGTRGQNRQVEAVLVRIVRR